MKFLAVKKGFYLIPAFDNDSDVFKKIAAGEIVECQVKKNRNYKLLQKFFVLLKIGFENQEQEQNKEAYRAKVLISIGYCYIVYLENGQANFIPKSISYEALPDDLEFEEIYENAVTYIANKLLVSNEDLAMEVASHF